MKYETSKTKQPYISHSVVRSLFLLLLNTGGTIAWLSLYNSGRFKEWWVFTLVIVCGLAALLQIPKLYKWVKYFF